jgi:hypothetical protein
VSATATQTGSCSESPSVAGAFSVCGTKASGQRGRSRMSGVADCGDASIFSLVL